MPVSLQTPLISYTANGSVTSFSFPFRIIYSTDLKVYLNGSQVISGFSVTGVDNPIGGNVVFTVAPANGVIVRLQRAVPLERTTDYVEGGQLAAQTMDNDFDRLVMMLQDNNIAPMLETPDATWDAQNKRIKNLADPIVNTDAVTKQYVDVTIPANVASAAANAASANASAIAAGIEAVNANASAAAALVSETNAAASAAIFNPAVLVNKDSATGAAQLPAGTTAQRPVAPVFGDTRANSTLTQTEWWNGTAWVPMGGGATGAPGNSVFFENDLNISANYTITTNKNAMSAGPITINNGVTVTIPNGSTWSIV